MKARKHWDLVSFHEMVILNFRHQFVGLLLQPKPANLIIFDADVSPYYITKNIIIHNSLNRYILQKCF